MLSPDMLRALVSAGLALGLLGGCASPPPPVVEQPAPEIISYSSVESWLNLQQKVAVMEGDEIVTRLAAVAETREVYSQVYQGLLYQQLQTNDAWSQARDIFRALHQDETLTEEQRQLTSILQEYNQNRINWNQRQSEILVENARLQQQLDTTEKEKSLLEQKIQALADLEAVISTRKE
jgi:hypothetical protein